MKCKNCEHSIFNETWGEYKCGLSKHTLYIRKDAPTICKDYKKRTEKKEGKS